jgi:hypothetical protein
LIRDWLRLAWHVDGMDYRQYLSLPRSERIAMHNELCDMLEDANPPTDGDDDDPEGGGPIRPKRMRR